MTLTVWFMLVDIQDRYWDEAETIANGAGRKLKDYLVTSGATDARFGGTNPSSSGVGDNDLLIHLCTTSLIRPAVAVSGGTVAPSIERGIAAGATLPMGSDGVLSEVYWSSVINRATTAHDRTLFLVGAAYHECVHNKVYGARPDSATYVHDNGGGGILGGSLGAGTLIKAPIPKNHAFMKKFIKTRVRQYPNILIWGY